MLTHVVNPTHFYVRLVIEQKAGVSVAKKINRLCSKENSHFTATDEMKTGENVENDHIYDL